MISKKITYTPSTISTEALNQATNCHVLSFINKGTATATITMNGGTFSLSSTDSPIVFGFDVNTIITQTFGVSFGTGAASLLVIKGVLSDYTNHAEHIF